MNKISPYEKKAQKEIEAWKNKKGGILSRTINFVGKPIGWIFDNVMPKAVSKTINKAVMGFMEMLKDVSYWTFSNKDIIKNAKKVGIEIKDYQELTKYELEKLDKIAQSYFSWNKIIAALEGAGCGLGGFALIAADIPALFGISFRAIQQIGSCYGFNMKNPEMFPLIMSIFNASSAASTAAKAAALTDMRIAVVALSKQWTYKKIAEKTQTGIIIKVLKDRTKKLPQDIAKNITKKKLGQSIPVVGAGIGAGFNYWFLSNTIKSSYMLFRDMYINSKYEIIDEELSKTEFDNEKSTNN